jgi:hypothetical protein
MRVQSFHHERTGTFGTCPLPHHLHKDVQLAMVVHLYGPLLNPNHLIPFCSPSHTFRSKLASVEHTLHRWLTHDLVLSPFTLTLTWLTNAPPLAAHGLILLTSSRPRNVHLVLFLLPLLCLPLVSGSPPTHGKHHLTTRAHRTPY